MQNSLAENLVSSQQEIDPKTGQVFKGDRLIERVAQKHFGGSGSKIDASYSNILGGYYLKQYREKVRELYNHNTSDNCQANSGDSNGISNSVASGITLNASWSIKVALFISSFLVGMWFLIRLFTKRKQQTFLILIGLGIAVTLGTATLSHSTRGKRRWKSKLLTTISCCAFKLYVKCGLSCPTPTPHKSKDLFYSAI